MARLASISKGIHRLSDEDCLDLAGLFRECLVYLLEVVSRSRRGAEGFKSHVEALKRKLDKLK